MRTDVRSVGPHSSFAGLAFWNQRAGLNRLAVVVEGTGWAIDDDCRVALRAGQGAFWESGEWSAFGADPDPPTELQRFCRILTLAGSELKLDQFLAANTPGADGGDVLLGLDRAEAAAARADSTWWVATRGAATTWQ